MIPEGNPIGSFQTGLTRSPARYGQRRSLVGAGSAVEALGTSQARLAQSAERKALNLVVVGSSPTVGAFLARHECDSGEFRALLFVIKVSAASLRGSVN